MQIITRYKARRAKRKQINKAYKELTSIRLLSAVSHGAEYGALKWDAYDKLKEIEHLENELCRL